MMEKKILVVGSGGIGKSVLSEPMFRDQGIIVVEAQDMIGPDFPMFPEPIQIFPRPEFEAVPFLNSALMNTKHRKGGNNRKGHKRKKAFNGRKKRK